jgi:hypothetical protein
MVLLFVMIYSFSVYFTQLVADHDAEKDPTHPDLFRYYATLDLTILSLFGSITGGLDWRDALEPLIRSISPLTALIFSFYIAFSVLAVMNVVTGVFVESALLSAKADQDIFMVNNLRDLFANITGDRAENNKKNANDLAMTWQDFRNRMHTRQMKDYFKSIDVDPSDAHGIFQLIDQENRGFVTFEEFVSGCCRLRGPAKAIDIHILLFELRQLKTKMDAHVATLEEELVIVRRIVCRTGKQVGPKGLRVSTASAVPRMSTATAGPRVSTATTLSQMPPQGQSMRPGQRSFSQSLEVGTIQDPSRRSQLSWQPNNSLSVPVW